MCVCVCVCYIYGASLVAQRVKNLPAMQETRVQSLGREDPLEEGMATHSRILAWRILWTEEPGGLQSMGGGWVQVDGGPESGSPCQKGVRLSPGQMGHFASER